MAVVARRLGHLSAPGSVREWEPAENQDFGRVISSVAAGLGIEAEPVETKHPDLNEFLLGAGPALLRLPGESPARFLVLARRVGRRVEILGPDLEPHRLPVDRIAAALVRSDEESVGESIDQLLDQAEVDPSRRPDARRAMLRERLNDTVIAGCWLLRLPTGAGVWEQARAAGLPRQILGFCTGHLLAGLFGLGSWWVLGYGALNGRLDPGWLLAWALLLVTLIPFQLLALWYQGLFSVAAGGLLKRRLIEGALRLHPDEIRLRGSGHHMGRVIESEAVETLALRGGFLALMAVIDILLAALVLSLGAAPLLLVPILLVWMVVAIHLGRRFFVERKRWARERLQISQELVEKMIGYRTRLAQQAPQRWHEGEDQALTHYLNGSKDVDRAAVTVTILPRAWLALALLGLAPTFLSGDATISRVAISVGGILLAYRAMEALREGFSFFADAAIAWEQVAFLFRTAERQEMQTDPGALAFGRSLSSKTNGSPLLDATELVFQHAGRGEPVLRGASLRIRVGDRVVVRSPSGGGKSTLVSLLNGSRSPQSGLLLLESLDRQTVGQADWTRRIASAPQFHENHVFSETFAFNLLMGRGWPPSPEDLDEAEQVCRELGLDELLERMPGGLLQMVGETGWQLSHGERSRLYIARALLQDGDLVILDESFAALDPENLRRSLDCALARAPSLMVISHA